MAVWRRTIMGIEGSRCVRYSNFIIWLSFWDPVYWQIIWINTKYPCESCGIPHFGQWTKYVPFSSIHLTGYMTLFFALHWCCVLKSTSLMSFCRFQTLCCVSYFHAVCGRFKMTKSDNGALSQFECFYVCNIHKTRTFLEDSFAIVNYSRYTSYLNRLTLLENC